MRDRRVRRTLEVVLVDRLKTRGYVDVEFLTDRFPTQNLKKSKNYLELYILGIKNNIEDLIKMKTIYQPLYEQYLVLNKTVHDRIYNKK